mgnify:CR=1 FL=1
MFNNDKGQSIVEYSLILGLVSVCVISVLTLTGDNLSNTFNIINKPFSEKTYKEEIEIGEYKIGDNFLGFYVDPSYETKFENVSYYLEIGSEKVPLTKGANFHCPQDTYCSTRTDMKMQDLLNSGAMLVMESNGEKIINTSLWDFEG